MIGSSHEHFECRKCGDCCRASGYVYLTDADIDAIAGNLQLAVETFTERYARLTENRAQLSLIERDDESCVFLGEENVCCVEAVKPRQCRQFPAVWRYKDMQHCCKGWSRNEYGDTGKADY